MMRQTSCQQEIAAKEVINKKNSLIFFLFLKGKTGEYNNNVHFEGVRFICGPHLAIIGPSEARADLMAR